MHVIRVGLIDDHPVVIAGIAALLKSAPDMCVVGEATTGAQGLRMIADACPDVAVIDVSLPDMTGLVLAQRLAETHPEIKLIALTLHESRAYVQPMLQSGARGYILKRSAAENLVRGIRAVADGGVYLDPAIAQLALPDGQVDRIRKADGPEPLSPREELVLRLTAQGFSNKEIAGKISVSVKSIETYKARAASKASLHSRAEIVRYGAARGWLDSMDREPS